MKHLHMKDTAAAFAAALVLAFSGALNAAPALDQLKAGEGPAAVPPPAASAPVNGSAAEADAALNSVFSLFGEPSFPAARPSTLNRGKDAGFTAELESQRDNYLRTEAYFTTGKGTKVRVSLAKGNCAGGGTACEGKDKAVFTLMADSGPYFLIRGMDIANFFPIYSGSRTVEIDGESYKIKLYPKPLKPVNSELEVKGPSGRGIKITMQRLSEVLIDKCVPLRLSRDYRMAYATEVDQADGKPKFTARRQLIIYPFPMTSDHAHTVLSVSDIKAGGTSFPDFEPSYTFSINAGVLKIAR